MSLSLSNLMLTGSATPYLHNGILPYEGDHHKYEVQILSYSSFIDFFLFQMDEGKVGIVTRNDIGFLIWTENEETTADLNLGSRLKTPVLPVWVTCVNDHWGVLFNPNRDLMKSHSAENRQDYYILLL